MDELTAKVIKAMDKALGDNVAPCYSELEKVAHSLGAQLCNGASRWAFVFKARRIVYKFPRWEGTDTDYCEIEMRNYELGKEYHIERCLLPVTFAGRTEAGIPLYIQPMYTTSHDGMGYGQLEHMQRKLHDLHNATIIRNIMNGCWSSPTRLWIERATQIYGKAFMKSFQEWTRVGKVNDLHSGNVGYLGKMPIIIDYAGYNG